MVDWVICPICKESDMSCESDPGGVGTYIHCVNLSCPSNVVGYEAPTVPYDLDAAAVALWNAEFNDHLTVEGFFRLHEKVRDSYRRKVKAVLAATSQPTLVETVRGYSNSIKNDRTLMSTWRHLSSEVKELAEEVQIHQLDGTPNLGGTAEHDGIVGECMDVINCALDIIFQVDPDFSEEKMIEIQERKCQKWAAKYG